MLFYGCTLFLSVGDLCTGFTTEGKKICSAIHTGKRVFPIEVSFKKRKYFPGISREANIEHIFCSFCFLLGPLSYLKSLFTAERRCFTVSYFVTLIGTLYFALHLQSTPLTIFCAVLQLIAMLSFLVSHIPGGTKGLMFFTRMFKSSVNSTLPV